MNDPKHYPKKSLLEEEQKTVYTGQSIQQMAKNRWGKKKDGKAND